MLVAIETTSSISALSGRMKSILDRIHLRSGFLSTTQHLIKKLFYYLVVLITASELTRLRLQIVPGFALFCGHLFLL